jgi:integrase
VAAIIKRGERWQAKVRRKGHPPQSETFRTKGLAEKWARDVEAQIDAGKFAPAPREARETTLDEALARYLRDVTPTKKTPRPEELKISALRRHPIAARPLAAIRGADVAALRDELAQRLAPSTVRLYLAIVSHLFNVARREWRFEGLANPVDDVTKPSLVGRTRRRRAQGDELARILRAAREVGAAWAPAAIELAVETAMRRGELLRLEWAHIDLGTAVAYLPDTKNGEPRHVPLTPTAVEIFRSLERGDSPKVFDVSAVASRASY